MADADAMAFANNFWGKDDSGVEILLQKMHNSKQCLEEVHAFYKERIAIEEEYSRKMLALSRKGLGTNEGGSLKQALDVIRNNTENMGKSHASAAQQVKAELDQPLETFSASLRSRRKTQQSTIEKLTKAKQSTNATCEKARAKFETDSNKINGYQAQQNLLLGKELEKNNTKLDKLHQTIDFSKRDYQNHLRSLADTIDRWNKEWKTSCDKFQDLEEERINFLKSNLWAYTNIVSSVCVSDDEGCENIRVALEKCDVTDDMYTFVRENGTGNEIQDPPEFVNFLQGYSRDSAPTSHQVANFSRESEDRDDSTPTSEAPTEPLAQPLSKRGSMATVGSRGSHAPSQALPQAQAQAPVPPAQAPAQQVPHLNFEDEDDANIPVLTHPEDGSSTAQSSPIQGDVSPNSSVYSNNTSISSVSVNDMEEDQKRRTWASPFRRRSKKDNSKGWNSPSSQQNTVKASSKDKQATTPNSVLSMGENMFDLGVSTRSGGSKSPFESRSRSQSPTKSMSRDDPLVKALEMLKVGEKPPSKYGAVGGGPADQQQPQQKRVSSRSAPTSPMKQKAQLVPPDPAFTADDMQSTSNKYHSQTQDMFQEQPARPPMQRPKSQADVRGAGAGGGGEQPTLRGRPKSFYQEEYYHEQEDPRMQYKHSRSKSASPIKQQNYDAARRTVSPAPPQQDPYRRSASPAPPQQQQQPPPPQDPYRRAASPQPDYHRRAASPHPPPQQYPPPRSASPHPPQGGGYQRSASPQPDYRRSASPQPNYYPQQQPPPPQQYYPQQPARSRAASPNPYGRQQQPPPQQDYNYDRRSKSAVDLSSQGGSSRGRSGGSKVKRPSPGSLPVITPEGRKVIRYSKALYDYRQAIPEEVSFRKGDVLLVTEELPDGWWHATVHGSNNRSGLAPSNFLADI